MPEVADIFRAHGEEYRQKNRMPLQHHRVMRAIEICRTVVLGGHIDECDSCGHEKQSYNSCRNRHCPKCQGSAAARWLKKREAELLPTPYFHVVLTVPDSLEPVFIFNQRIMYNILFRAASDTLLEVSKDKRNLGAYPGFFMMLHTWGQTQIQHTHVHSVVPAGGISLDDSRWVKGNAKFLLPVPVLSEVFRGKFLAYFKMACASGEIKFAGAIAHLEDSGTRKQFVDELYNTKWVTYAKKPFGGPALVLRYLARYTHRIAISNNRIEKFENARVTFRYRDYRDKNKTKRMTLDAMEFIRRFLLHVLPERFVKMRYYGFMANRKRKENIARCRELIGVGARNATSTVMMTDDATCDSAIEPATCPKCGKGKMLRIREIIACCRERPP